MVTPDLPEGTAIGIATTFGQSAQHADLDSGGGQAGGGC